MGAACDLGVTCTPPRRDQVTPGASAARPAFGGGCAGTDGRPGTTKSGFYFKDPRRWGSDQGRLRVLTDHFVFVRRLNPFVQSIELPGWLLPPPHGKLS